MKKQLLIITLLLSGYVGTSQAMREVRVVHNLPKVLKQGDAVQVDMHNGLKSQSDNSGVVHVSKTDYGHKVTAGRSGTAVLKFFNDKGVKRYSKTVTVAARSVDALRSVKVGEKKYAQRKEDEKFTQTNKGKKDAGEVSIKHMRNGLVKVTGRKAGRVEVESQDTGAKNWILISPKQSFTIKNDTNNVKDWLK